MRVCVLVLLVLGVCRARSDCGISLVPVDDDLLSMEMPEAFKVGGGADVDAVHCMGHRLALVGGCGVLCDPAQECYIEEDMSSLTYVARAVMDLQRRFGVIPNLKSKGVLAKVGGAWVFSDFACGWRAHHAP